MKVLVTGGAGFIGSNFVHHVARRTPTAQVTVLDALTYAGNREASPAPGRTGSSFVHGRHRRRRRWSTRWSPSTDVGRPLRRRVAQRQLAATTRGRSCETNIVGTYTLLEAVRRHGMRLHHISTDEVYGDLELDDPERFTEATPYNPSSPYSLDQGRLRPAGARLGALASACRRRSRNCSNNYGPVPARREVHPAPDHQRPRRRAGPSSTAPGENVRDWIHVDDHNAAVLAILEQGRIGETYLIGADGEQNNLEVVELILELHGPAGRLRTTTSPTGPGHDLRYAIDSTKLRAETRLAAAATATSAPAWPRPSTGTATTRPGGRRPSSGPSRPTSASAAEPAPGQRQRRPWPGSLGRPTEPAQHRSGRDRRLVSHAAPRLRRAVSGEDRFGCSGRPACQQRAQAPGGEDGHQADDDVGGDEDRAVPGAEDDAGHERAEGREGGLDRGEGAERRADETLGARLAVSGLSTGAYIVSPTAKMPNVVTKSAEAISGASWAAESTTHERVQMRADDHEQAGGAATCRDATTTTCSATMTTQLTAAARPIADSSTSRTVRA